MIQVNRTILLIAAAVVLAAVLRHGVQAQDAVNGGGRTGELARLAPTQHPPLPAQLSQYWLVPAAGPAATHAGRPADDATARLARGVALLADGNAAAALPLVSSPDVANTPLAGYAQYYTGVALSELSRLADADATLTAVAQKTSDGYLRELAVARLADVAIARQDASRAEDVLEDLSDEKLGVPEEVFLRLARAEEAIGHRDHALDAYRRIYYDFPLSAQAADAERGLERLGVPSLSVPETFGRELRRAEQLFAARRWAQARAAFVGLSRAAQGDNRQLVAVRIGEADYYLDRYHDARTALAPLLDGGPREAEARFFHLTATYAAGDRDSYLRLARGLVADHPTSDWTAETLNNLASHYIRLDQDDEADRVFRDLLRLLPQHRYGERAAWKAGWRAYRAGNFKETAELFESAAVRFPRADNRPAWIYWSGRARDQLGDPAAATARYRLAVADYQNTYYGRLASKILAERGDAPVPDNVRAADLAAAEATPNGVVIRALIGAGLYDQALDEIRYAQRVWGDSPQLQASTAWIRHQQGLGLKAQERFTALRGAINTMRRAYPQFMAAGGEKLPPEVLRIIFPIDYWNLITKYSKQYELDPYLVTALMAQESTFTAEIRSAANAYGLMQLIPGTGRIVARQLGIRGFNTSMLTNAETNVRLGTRHFRDLIDDYGGAHFALAAYNAGPHRVARWKKEFPGLPQDEFIDNIPYEETRTYVKRILGTAEDYRRLYGSGVLDANTRLVAQAAPAAPAAAVTKAPAKKPAARRPARRARTRR